jgi:hypothetical protein
MSRKLGGSKLTKPYNRQWLTKNPVELLCRLFKCTLFGEIQLFLYAGVNAKSLQIDSVGQGGKLPKDAPDDWLHDFRFTVANDARAGLVKLHLIYRESENGQPRDATSIELLLESTNAAQPLISCCIFANASIPKHTAILHIYPADETHVSLIGWVGEVANPPRRLSPIDTHKLPDLSADATEDGLRRLQAQMHALAVYNEGNVAGWFEDVIALYREECSLVINDMADSRILWEMFKLKEGRYLGEEALVVRWMEAQHRQVAVSMSCGEETLEGRITACIPPRAGNGVLEILPALRNLPNNSYPSIDDLQYELLPNEGASPPIALVYVDCEEILHYGDEGETELPKGHTLKLRFDDVEGQVKARPIFFANAPFSGRIFRGRQTPRGIVSAVLREVGAGYVGILGRSVDHKYAAEIAGRFLQTAMSAEGICPAQFFRSLRKEASKNLIAPSLSPERRKEARRRRDQTFLYVYYGNPQTRVRILAPSSPANSPGK